MHRIYSKWYVAYVRFAFFVVSFYYYCFNIFVTSESMYIIIIK